MIRLCHENRTSVLEKVRNGELEAAELSTTNLVDEIILSMFTQGILSCISEGIQDKRADNTTIPFDLVWALAIAAKMKVKTSLTDIPFAINNHRVLSALGYTIIDTAGKLGYELMKEGSLRFLIGKYSPLDLFNGYNIVLQKHIMPKMNIVPDIHLLDCTKLEVNYNNLNYEDSGVSTDSNGNKMRGYKLSTLRGITGDSGIIEEIAFGAANIHDLTLSENIIKYSPCLKPGDILINDRGFMSRDILNYLKTYRQVDTYVPVKKNMNIYKEAVSIAIIRNKWIKHPNPKRTDQKVAFVDHLKYAWQSDYPENDVEINAAVVWNEPEDEYAVFVTTDVTKDVRQIILTYELRPEIEEDYRQLKDFWKLEDFKSTKLKVIAFHIICVLFGYLFFQLYTMSPDGEEYSGKSLPVVLKNYIPKAQSHIVLYVGNEFGVISIIEFAELYSNCKKEVKDKLSEIFTNL